MTPTKSNRGGPREHAGRKLGSGRFGEPTTPLRVPATRVDEVLTYLHLPRADTTVVDVRPVSQNAPTIPLKAMLSRVPAGFPSPAADYSEELDLNQHLIIQGHGEATFVLRVSGHSMIGAGIFDGDEVIVDRAITPKPGNVVVAAVNGEMTIKRLAMLEGKPVLHAENPNYAPRSFTDGDELSIWGVVTRVLHRV